MICENCGNDHTGEFGSGRFCSLKCSRSFSTKNNRTEISKKIANSLRKISLIRNCKICGTEFYSKIVRTKTCSSSECRKLNRSLCMLGTKSKSGPLRKKGSGGLRDGGGKSKVYEYISSHNEKMFLNLEELTIAKLLDDLKATWNRNTRGFEYEDNEKIRKFYPDFYVDELKSYVEYKGWITDQMRRKMNSAVSKNDFNLIIVVGKDERIKDDGISIEEFKRRLEEVL